jgi:hypothetical protein
MQNGGAGMLRRVLHDHCSIQRQLISCGRCHHEAFRCRRHDSSCRGEACHNHHRVAGCLYAPGRLDSRGRLRGRLRRDIFRRRHSQIDGCPSHGHIHSQTMGPYPRRPRYRNSLSRNSLLARIRMAHIRSIRTSRSVGRRC